MLSKEILKELNEKYPKGTRVELISMEDLQAPSPGTLGTVKGIDAIGSVLVEWDNGSSLNVLYNIDQIKVL